MTVMIDAEYVLKIIGDQLYGEMSAGDEYLYDHKTYDDGLEWCFELIRNVANNTQETISAASPKWISVKDRLPEADGEVVLACYQPRKPNYIFFAYFNGSWAIYQPTEDGLLYSHPVRVSHWMPLPEPPEVEDGNIGQTSRESSRTGRG